MIFSLKKKCVLSLLIFSVVILLGMDTAYATITITPDEQVRYSLKLITLTGSVDEDADNVMFEVIYPDGTIHEHTASLQKKGLFNYFLNPDKQYPPGTYIVDVYSVHNGEKPDNRYDAAPEPKFTLEDTGAFNIYMNSDKAFEFSIQRGSGNHSCGNDDSPGCMVPPFTTVYAGSLSVWQNDDSHIHDIAIGKKEFVGLLKPGESKEMIIKGTGNITYACTIHPWVSGEIKIIPNSFKFPKRVLTIDIVEPEPEIIPDFSPPPLPGKKPAPEPIVEEPQEPEIIKVPDLPTPMVTIPCEACFGGTVTKVVDGDTLDIDGDRIRLALVNTPERGEVGYKNATEYTTALCPVDSTAYFAIDLKQPVGPYGRVIAEVFCGGESLNKGLIVEGYAHILTQYCGVSSFASSVWAANACGYVMVDNPDTFHPILEPIINTTVSETTTIDEPTTKPETEIIPENDVTAVATNTIEDIRNLIPTSFSGNGSESNPFNPDNFSITTLITIMVIGVVLVVVVLIKSKRNTSEYASGDKTDNAPDMDDPKQIKKQAKEDKKQTKQQAKDEKKQAKQQAKDEKKQAKQQAKDEKKQAKDDEKKKKNKSKDESETAPIPAPENTPTLKVDKAEVYATEITSEPVSPPNQPEDPTVEVITKSSDGTITPTENTPQTEVPDDDAESASKDVPPLIPDEKPKILNSDPVLDTIPKDDTKFRSKVVETLSPGKAPKWSEARTTPVSDDPLPKSIDPDYSPNDDSTEKSMDDDSTNTTEQTPDSASETLEKSTDDTTPETVPDSTPESPPETSEKPTDETVKNDSETLQETQENSPENSEKTPEETQEKTTEQTPETSTTNVEENSDENHKKTSENTL